MLEDKDEGGKNITARILIKKETLFDWIRVVKKEDEQEDAKQVQNETDEENPAAEQTEVKIAS